MLLSMTTTPPPEPDTAAEWIGRLAIELGVEPMTLQTQAALLSIARDVAHGTERKYAPLASFVAGRYVELALHEGRSIESAVRDVSDAVSRLVGDPPATP
jgi:hypothetical protein